MAAAGIVQAQASTATAHMPVKPATTQRIMAATIDRGRMYDSIHRIIWRCRIVYLPSLIGGALHPLAHQFFATRTP